MGKKEKKITISIIFILVLTTSLILAKAVEQTVTVEVLPTGNIVINEAEINAPGSDTNKEWIEIFNDGNPVDLTGWYITDEDGDRFFFPSLILNDFYVLEEVFSPALSNTGQILTLYNHRNEIIDTTGIFSDSVGDGKTYSRIPNGFGDFRFTNPTKGFTNNDIEIFNKSINPECVLETDRVNLSVFVNSSCIEEVIFSVLLNDIWVNFSGINVEDNRYEVTLENLSRSTQVNWTVYAKDCSNNTVHNGIESFYLNSRTTLLINPENPDGLNNWYVTEPQFSLENPDATELFYRWDASNAIQYSSPFKLENAPNNGNITAGILELNYWSNVCEIEEIQTEILMIDLTNPEIKDLSPANNTIVFDLMPTISAYLDDIYGSNSGIDLNSAVMMLDGLTVPAQLTPTNSIDAIISFKPDTNLSVGNHTVKVSVSDNSGRRAMREWQFEVMEPLPFDFFVHSPENRIYNQKRVPFNISASQILDRIEYKDDGENNPRFRNLCTNCNNYGFSTKKLKSLSEGEHNLTFKGTDNTGSTIEGQVNLFIDSRDPRILKAEPRRGFASGNFEVEFIEENPYTLLFQYGNLITGFREEEIDIDACTSGRKIICNITILLEDYDMQEIEYIFNLIDIGGNNDISRRILLDVDTTKPVINFFNFTIDRRRVEFFLNITEKNLEEIIYIDFNENRPRERILCRSLDEGICNVRKSFSRGEHSVVIIVKDEARNSEVIEDVFFEIA